MQDIKTQISNGVDRPTATLENEGEVTSISEGGRATGQRDKVF